MGRTLADAAALFAAPFVLYAALLVLRQRYPFLAESWPRGAVAMLAGAGLGLVLVGLLLVGGFAERHKGPYVPAHIENGVLVPGQIQ